MSSDWNVMIELYSEHFSQESTELDGMTALKDIFSDDSIRFRILHYSFSLPEKPRNIDRETIYK